MVLSRINNKITFQEDKFLEKEDKGFAASLYEIEINGNNIIIALGDIKYKFIDDGVLYAPIYLIIDDKVSMQIGVYEFESENLMDLLDEDGDLDIEKLNDPLLYKFATDEFLKNKEAETKKEDDEDEEEVSVEGDEEAEKKADESEPEGTVITDDEETDEESEESKMADELEKQKFKESKDSLWIQKLMRRNEYNLVDSLYENVGSGVAGDCLFVVIHDALKSAGDTISVEKMRQRLASEMDLKTYTEYKEFYDLFHTSVQNDQEQLLKLKAQHDELRKQADLVKTTNRSEYKIIVTDAKHIEQDFKRIKEEKQTSEKYLEEFDFMRGIHSLEEMKAKIQTCDFWADTWAISILEKILNIKLIILSSEKFKENDINNVLLCGQINDEKEIEEGEFKPKYYIMVDHTGDHYKLITWRNKKVLTFKEIPYGIRELIVNKCMERNAGKFSLIPKFKKYKEDQEKIDYHPDLYTENTVLQFYSKSSPKPFPGKGAGEKLKSEEKDKYLELSRIPDWRKKLSNFYKSEFILDKRKWQSVENYYHSSKFKEENPEFSLLFSLDSGSEISKDPILAKKAGGKTGTMKKTIIDDQGVKKNQTVTLRPSTIKVDHNFFKKRAKNEMKRAWEAKFTQNQELKDLLLKTNDAKLQHFVRGKNPEIWVELMEIRKI